LRFNPRSFARFIGDPLYAAENCSCEIRAVSTRNYREINVGSPPARSSEEQIGRNPELVTQGADLLDG
jgi:hypothetical protein